MTPNFFFKAQHLNHNLPWCTTHSHFLSAPLAALLSLRPNQRSSKSRETASTEALTSVRDEERSGLRCRRSSRRSKGLCAALCCVSMTMCVSDKPPRPLRTHTHTHAHIPSFCDPCALLVPLVEVLSCHILLVHYIYLTALVGLWMKHLKWSFFVVILV